MPVMKHLVLAGAGHAHLETMRNIRSFVEDGVRVTVIGPAPNHYYSGMGPGMLGGFYQPAEIRFAVKKQVEAQRRGQVGHLQVHREQNPEPQRVEAKFQ